MNKETATTHSSNCKVGSCKALQIQMCITRHSSYTQPTCIPITTTPIWYFRNLCLPSVWSFAIPLSLKVVLLLTCWREKLIAWESSYLSFYKHWIRTSVLFKKFSDVCSCARVKGGLQKTKKTPFIVVLWLLTKCEIPECRRMFSVMQEYKFPPMAHYSHMPTVSMREMSDRERNCQGHVKLPYVYFNHCER